MSAYALRQTYLKGCGRITPNASGTCSVCEKLDGMVRGIEDSKYRQAYNFKKCPTCQKPATNNTAVKCKHCGHVFRVVKKYVKESDRVVKPRAKTGRVDRVAKFALEGFGLPR